ncbi:4-hydroxythreonine-4-phosphate dehydrogenase PdxA, partial [bacterium]|nr:4-hydroxythreonine-4-phosphate dehydrogenase PdxA [bacterium]
MKKPVIAITLGDTGGIGPEIITKALANKQVYECCTPVIIGIKEALYKTKKITLGKPNPLQAKAAVEFLKQAAAFALKKKVDAIVTAPVNKYAINASGIKFSGQTEFLATLTNTHKYAMVLVSPEMRIVPLTRHVPIKDIGNLIKKQYILDTIDVINLNSYLFGIHKPSIAVLSLNPHCGDGGAIGNEEITKIIPAINEALKKGMNVQGPFSSDAFFGNCEYKRYDFILAMYHDQGLI